MSFIIPLIKGFTTSISLITAIGPQNSFVLKQAILRSHILLVAAFCSIIDGILITLGVNGVGAIMSSFPDLIELIKYAGIIFLFFYGLKMIYIAFTISDLSIEIHNIKNQEVKKIIFTILVVSLLNPHTYLDSMVLIGAVGAHFSGIERTMFILGSVFASITWFFLLAYFGRFLSPIFNNLQGHKIFNLVIGLMMWAIAWSLI